MTFPADFATYGLPEKMALDALKELATAATPGNWALYENPPVTNERYVETLTGDSHYTEDGPYMAITSDLIGASEDDEYFRTDTGLSVIAANARYYPTPLSDADMRYVAAVGPRVILALIAELEAYRYPYSPK